MRPCASRRSNNVSAGLSRRSSQQDLLNKGILKRPPTESQLLAAPAVTLEKALTHDRISDRLLTTIQAYVSVTQTTTEKDKEISSPGGLSVKERMEAYMKAVREANSTPRQNNLGLGIRSRVMAYEQGSKSSSSLIEAKTAESPTASSSQSKSPVIEGLSLKERLAAYQETASSPRVKKEVEIVEVGTIHGRVADYVGNAVAEPGTTEGEKF